MRKYLFLLLCSGVLAWSLTAQAQTMDQYQSFPTFMSSNIKPNVVLLLDNSGSMKSVANGDPINYIQGGAGTDYIRANYDSGTSYYGYFESGSMYSYDEPGGYFYEDNASGEWSGNFLNWATMRRVDVARKVLVGGKVGWTNRQVPEPGPYYLLGQNEPWDDRFGPVAGWVNADGLTPAQSNTTVHLDYQAGADSPKLALGRFVVGDKMEVGRIKMTGTWTRVDFSTPTGVTHFTTVPAVVAKPMVNTCVPAGAGVVAIKDVDVGGFSIRAEDFAAGAVCELDYKLVTFMAVTPGHHTIGDLELEAGIVSTSKCGMDAGSTFEYVTFDTAFWPTPRVIMSTVNTRDDPTDLVMTRHKNASTVGFNVMMQELEQKDNVHGIENIGWIAIAQLPGSGTVAGQDFEVGSIGVNHVYKTINFTSGFTNAPFILADMQTYSGVDPANLLMSRSRADYAIINVQEDTWDGETAHANETVGYVAISMPSYNVKIEVTEKPTGIVQQIQAKVRLGLAVYNYDHTRTGDDVYNMGPNINGGTLWPGWEWENMAECDSVRNDSLSIKNVGGRDICEVPTHVKAPTENIIRAIEEYPQVWGGTPTAETLYEVGRYFQRVNPYFNQTDLKKGAAGAELGQIFDTTDEWDPYYYDEFASENANPECGESFVIVISDGHPAFDFTLGKSDGSDPDDPNIIGAIASYNDPDGVEDQDYVDDVAYYLNTHDLRPGGATVIPGDQTVSAYTIFASFRESDLSAEASMEDAAKYGGFMDINNNDMPDLDVEWDRAPADGIADHYFKADNGHELWAKLQEAIIQILTVTASGSAASVLSTSGGAAGVVFQAYFEPSVEGTTPDKVVNWLGYMKALWVDPWGNLREDSNENRTLELSGVDSDLILQFIQDPYDDSITVYKYEDGMNGENPDGVRDECPDPECYPGKGGACAGNCTIASQSNLDGVIPIWEAGKLLTDRGIFDRIVWTWIDFNNDGLTTDDEVIPFNENNTYFLRPYLGIDDPAKTLGENLAEAQKLIRFILGIAEAGYRDRTVLVDGVQKVWKLGDIVNSTPTVVGKPSDRMDIHYGDESYFKFFDKYVDRYIGVYVGANDGMLHAFNAGTFANGGFSAEAGWGGCNPPPDGLGKEEWAYIPYNLLPHLRWLADPNYSHVAYVDLKPKVADARIFADDNIHPGGWGTVLVGGMGFGGGVITLTDDFDYDVATPDTTKTFRPSYFGIDITRVDIPNGFFKPYLLWERTHEKLGFTTSYPSIVRVADARGSAERGEWFAVFGSGPTDYDGTSDQFSRLFVLNLYNGTIANLDEAINEVYSAYRVGVDGFMTSPVVVDYPVRGAYNYSDDMIYIGETYATLDPFTREPQAAKGRILRFSTRRDNPNPADFPYETDPEFWLRYQLSDSFQPLNGGGSCDPWQPLPPITAPVAVARDKQENVWVYFGTGRFFNELDKVDNSTQYFFGVIDDFLDYDRPGYTDDSWNGITAVTNLACNGNTSDLVIKTDGTIDVNGSPAGYTFQEAVDYLKTTTRGWYTELNYDGNGGERVITRPNVFGEMVFFTTFKPGDVCGFGGDSYLYALYHETGTASHKKSILGTKTIGADTVYVKAASLGKGKASEVGIHTNRMGRKSKLKLITQQSSGVVDQRDAFAIDVNARIIGWMQQ